MSEDHHVCPAELAGILDNRVRRWLQNPRKLVGPYLREGMTVMDFGCGPGFFTLEMAELVGENGRVIAADVQPEMIRLVAEKIEDDDVADRITLHVSQPERIGWTEPVDFVLAFYVVHELPTQDSFFAQLRAILRPGGQVLVVEPPLHVSRQAFKTILGKARAAGFNVKKGPRMLTGMTAILEPA